MLQAERGEIRVEPNLVLLIQVSTEHGGIYFVIFLISEAYNHLNLDNLKDNFFDG